MLVELSVVEQRYHAVMEAGGVGQIMKSLLVSPGKWTSRQGLA